MPITTLTLGEFIAEHGAPLCLIAGDDTRTLPDGSQIVPSWTGKEPSQIPPPSDPTECLQLKLKYAKRKLEKAESAFAAYRRFALGQSFQTEKWDPCFGPQPKYTGDPADVDYFCLGVLAEVARKARKELQLLEKEWEQLPGCVSARQYEAAALEAERERSLRKQERIAKIEAIHI